MGRIAMGLLGLMLFAACGDGTEALPPELLGVWRTEAPRYRDGHFELRENWVVFGASRFEESTHRIRSVRSSDAGDSTGYRIEYALDDGETALLSLLYTPGRPPQLRVGRREAPWVPEASAHWLEEDRP